MARLTEIKQKILQLDSGSFQILCDAYLSKEGYPNLVALGTNAGSAKTTRGTPDTYFSVVDDKYVFAEYTTQQSNIVAKIREDLEKCLDETYTDVKLSDITEIVYCHTSSNISPKEDSELRKMCSQHGIQLTMIGIDKLAEDLLSKYPLLLKDHLGIAVDTEQIQTMDDFVKQYDAKSLSASLDTQFKFRDKELQTIQDHLKTVDVVILTGAPGAGKTRLALEFASKYAAEHGSTLYCIHNKGMAIYDDLKGYFEKPGKYIVVVDDANQLSQMDLILEYANKREKGYEVKFLITVRNYALQKVKDDLNGNVHYEELTIQAFSDDEIKAIAGEHYGINNGFYLDRIAEIADGNARIAMLAGKTALTTGSLGSIQDVSQLYEEYYGKEFRNIGIDQNMPLIITAGIIAFLNSLHMDYIDSLQPVLQDTGISLSAFRESVYKLHELEVVDICRDKAVSFSEQCFENYILKYVYFDKKFIRISAMVEACFVSFQGRTVQALNTLMGVFQIPELHEYVKDEIEQVWKKLQLREDPHFWDFVKMFYHINEEETLMLLQDKIDQEASVHVEASELGPDYKGNPFQFGRSDDILQILEGFADSYENIDTALDLFFLYYSKRPDKYKKILEITINSYGIRRKAVNDIVKVPGRFLDKIIEHSDNWENPYITVLFLDVAQEWLKFIFSIFESNRKEKSFTSYSLHIAPSNEVKQFRSKIWRQLINIGEKKHFEDRIHKVLTSYARGVSNEQTDILQDDSQYILHLIKILFPEDSITGCIIADHMNQLFTQMRINGSEELSPYLSSKKFQVYNMMVGSRWDTKIPYEEYKDQKYTDLDRYIQSAENNQTVIKRIFSIVPELMDSKIKAGDLCSVCEGIDHVIPMLISTKDDCLYLSRAVISVGIDLEIRINPIIERLMQLCSADEAYDITTSLNTKYKNIWLYAFFCKLPSQKINMRWVEKLYEFLRDDSDNCIGKSPYRDLCFLEKYKDYDSEIWIKSSRIILSKQSYSTFIPNLYFWRLFVENESTPQNLLSKYESDPKLLQDIYLFEIENDELIDIEGHLLKVLCREDPNFLRVFIQHSFSRDTQVENEFKRLLYIFDNENFSEDIDTIINEVSAVARFPDTMVPELIGLFLTAKSYQEDLEEKSKAWGHHYISVNSHEKRKMRDFFEGLSERSNDQKTEFVESFLRYNNNLEDFKDLPLIPNAWSCTGSAVPLFSGWIDFFNSILPLLPGIEFLKHKKYIKEQIARVQHMIEEEEISEILEG